MFFGKGKTAGQLEVFNDADGELINIYRCIQHHAPALAEELSMLPQSRELFFDCVEQEQIRGLTDIQRAARSLYLIKMSFGSDRDTFATAKRGLKNMLADFSTAYRQRSDRRGSRKQEALTKRTFKRQASTS